MVARGPAQSQARSLASTGERVIRKALVSILITPKLLNGGS
jgi:hypothetical protein